MNLVTGFHWQYPGIYVPVGKTLTIQGDDGKLTARSNGAAAGIGAGYNAACGNIVIESGTIVAYGYSDPNSSPIYGAGIGGAWGDCGDITINGGHVTAYGALGGTGIGSGNGACGNISITGGTVIATGGDYAAGIGGGIYAQCGTITIAKTITSVTATKGNHDSSSSYTNPYSIGVGSDYCKYKDGTACKCGTITFDTYSFTPTFTKGNAGSDNEAGTNDDVENTWTYSPEPADGTTYGGLKLDISDNTWTLTP